MAEGKLSVCPQCGKKFKLKAGFSAASFACTACGATVWVDGKPPAPSTGRRKAAGGRRGRKAAPAPRRGRSRQEAEPAAEGHGGRRGRYQKQNNNSMVVVGVIGGLVLLTAVIFFAMGGFGGDEKKVPVADTGGGDKPGMAAKTDGCGSAEPEGRGDGCGCATDGCGTGNATAKADGCGEGSGCGEAPSKTDPNKGSDATPTEDQPKPTKRLGKTNKTKRKPGTSRWDPPANLGHLDSTPADLRKQIDEQIALMMDPMAGRDSLVAKQKLAAIGKPAFLPILGAMAKIRDTITDVDSHEERLIESSLKLADQCLREMDGFLESKEKGLLRPGTDMKYIKYILRLHYKRWIQVLEKMPEMPGPYDPATAYEKDEGPEKNYDDDD